MRIVPTSDLAADSLLLAKAKAFYQRCLALNVRPLNKSQEVLHPTGQYFLNARLRANPAQDVVHIVDYYNLRISSVDAEYDTVYWKGGVGPFDVAFVCMSVGACDIVNVNLDVVEVSKAESAFALVKDVETDGWCAQDDAGEQLEVGVLIIDTGVTPTREIFAPLRPAITYDPSDGVTKTGLSALYEHFGPGADCTFPITFTDTTASSITWTGGISPFTVSEYRVISPNNIVEITPGDIPEGDCGEDNVDIVYTDDTTRTCSVEKFAGYEADPWCAACHGSLANSGIVVTDFRGTKAYLPYADMTSGPPFCAEPLEITVDPATDSVSWTGGTSPYFVEMEADTITNTTLAYGVFTTTTLSNQLSGTGLTASVYPTDDQEPWCYTGATTKGAVRITDSSDPAQSKRAFFDAYGGDPLWAYGPSTECIYPLVLDTITGSTFTWAGGKPPYIVMVSKFDPEAAGDFVFNNTTVAPGVTTGLTATIGRLVEGLRTYCSHDANTLQDDVGIMVTDAQGTQLFIPYDYFEAYAPTIICAAILTWSPTSQSLTYEDLFTTQYHLNASGNVAGSITYKFSDSSGASLGATVSTATQYGAGSYYIAAVLVPTDQNHYYDVLAVKAFSIGKKSVTITLSGLNPTYDGTPKAVSNNSGYTVTTTYNGSTVAPTNAGSYAVVCTINDANYQGSVSGTLTIAKASQTLGVISMTYSGGAPVSPKVGMTGTISVASRGGSTSPVVFTSTNTSVCVISGTSFTLVGAGTFDIYANQAGDNNYNAASQRTYGVTTVYKNDVTLTWATPAAIVEGTALSSSQLNATANAAGSFTYTPTFGHIPPVSSAYPLRVDFTPSDSATFNTATKTVYLVVIKMRVYPVITWTPAPATQMEAGDSPTWMNASANVAGTFVYTPTTTSGFNPGYNNLRVDFTPTDLSSYYPDYEENMVYIRPKLLSYSVSLTNSRYNNTTTPGTVKVKSTNTLTWTLVSAPAQGSVSLNATTGAFTYTPPDVATAGSTSFTYKCTEAGVDSYTRTATISWGAAWALVIWASGGNWADWTAGIGPYNVTLFGQTYCTTLFAYQGMSGYSIYGLAQNTIYAMMASGCTSWWFKAGAGIQVADRWGRTASILFNGSNFTIPLYTMSWKLKRWCTGYIISEWHSVSGCVIGPAGTLTTTISYDGLKKIQWGYMNDSTWLTGSGCSLAGTGVNANDYPWPCSLQANRIGIMNYWQWE